MTNIPDEHGELIVQKTQLGPVDPRDSRTVWQIFVDGLRQTIGLKPIYLAERWAAAKVRQEEVDAESRLLAAKANYELAMAQIRRMDRESESKQNVDEAVVDYLRSKTMSPEIMRAAIAQLRNAYSQSPEQALENLLNVIQKIEQHGGTVEFDLLREAKEDDER